MRARNSTKNQLTLSDVVATVSRFARNEREAAAVVNHLLISSQISFANRGRATAHSLSTYLA
jgi:hypothetical protein